jgi:hypothetical protein
MIVSFFQADTLLCEDSCRTDPVTVPFLFSGSGEQRPESYGEMITDRYIASTSDEYGVGLLKAKM